MDFDLMRPMTDTQRLLFQTEMLKHRKSVGVAAVLCFLGPFGVHRFYLGQIGLGLLYLCTFGLLVVGALVDLLRIGSLVESVNDSKAREVAAQIIALPAGETAMAARGATRATVTPPARSRVASTLVITAVLLLAIIWLVFKLGR
jgi:TM2 domain-containing membrane protein YozV